MALLTWFLPSSFDMSQILVVPSSENVANSELSIRAQILGGWGGGETHYVYTITFSFYKVIPSTSPINGFLMFIDVSNQLALWCPPVSIQRACSIQCIITMLKSLPSHYSGTSLLWTPLGPQGSDLTKEVSLHSQSLLLKATVHVCISEVVLYIAHYSM